MPQTELRLSFHWYDFFFFILMVGGGALVYGGIFVTLASLGFWSDAKSSIMPLMYNIGNYGRYPVNIYNRVIRFVLTFVLPFAFVGVYPATYFLKKSRVEQLCICNTNCWYRLFCDCNNTLESRSKKISRSWKLIRKACLFRRINSIQSSYI